jgi:hypothetical protein
MSIRRGAHGRAPLGEVDFGGIQSDPWTSDDGAGMPTLGRPSPIGDGARSVVCSWPAWGLVGEGFDAAKRLLPTPSAAVVLAPALALAIALVSKSLAIRHLIITQPVPSCASVAMCTPQQAVDPFAAALISALRLMQSLGGDARLLHSCRYPSSRPLRRTPSVLPRCPSAGSPIGRSLF